MLRIREECQNYCRSQQTNPDIQPGDSTMKHAHVDPQGQIVRPLVSVRTKKWPVGHPPDEGSSEKRQPEPPHQEGNYCTQPVAFHHIFSLRNNRYGPRPWGIENPPMSTTTHTVQDID